MSGSIQVSQTNQPATITITPGPGVAFTGVGAPGVGYLSAAVAPNGHLMILRSDGVTMDCGAVAPVVAACVPAGSNAPTDATPLTAAVSLLVAGVPGGALVLQPGINQARRIVNKLGYAVPVYPPPGCQIDQLGAGVPLLVQPGTSETLYSPDGVSWTSE